MSAQALDFRKMVAFGFGLGMEVRSGELRVSLARVRPAGVTIVASAVIAGFDERPAAEWGAELNRFLAAHGAAHLAACVVLPRREVVARQLTLPGVPARELDAAVGFQLESLHPFGDEEIVHAWVATGHPAQVLVGVMRRSRLDHFTGLFSEAGLSLAAFTFLPSAVRAARTLYGAPEGPVLAYSAGEQGSVEIYGESPARGVFSADLDLPAEQALLLAGAELRMEGEWEPRSLDAMLPAPLAAPEGRDARDFAAADAAALLSAAPWLTRHANLLPADRRSSSSRAIYIPTLALAALLLIAAAAAYFLPHYRQDQMLQTLSAEAKRVEPQARRASQIDGEIQKALSRTRLLEDFRSRTQADMEALNELTQILTPPAWTNSVELTRDALTLAGEADQAAPLLRLIDGSPFFQNSEFAIPIARGNAGEIFRIRSQREATGKRDAKPAPEQKK